jgi:hypothetical protein
MNDVKDIFIDNNIAKNFANPSDLEYKKLVDWLIRCDENTPEKNAYIVVSKKLLGEYSGATIQAKSTSNITAILKIMNKTVNGHKRIIEISNDDIKAFHKTHKIRDKALKKTYNKLGKDKTHIPLVMLSNRKYALTYDENFAYILKNFPGFKVLVEKRPEKLPYEKGDPL